jgi:lipopolysaccharide/colanic/teichoic acid biosynthesis glycosyltransferase
MRVSWNGIARSRGRLLKAASDQVGAIIPVVLLAALLVVWLTLLASNGVRVSYRYRSIGEGGCIKLRAMTTDAEHELETDPVDPAKWLAAWKQNDIAPLLKPITLCSFSAVRSNPALVWISTNHQAGLCKREK